MNSSAWDKFRKQQATEREQLRRLLWNISSLLTQCRTITPNEIELSALAATLHSFYTGVENIFKRVSIELDGEPVRGDNWHRNLLLRMKSPSPRRPALLSESLHDALLEYLRFRHVFRNAYAFDLDWQKMSPLVLKLEDTFKKLEGALDAFLKSRPSAEDAPNTGDEPLSRQ